MIKEIMDSGAADKFFNMFGKKEEETKEVITGAVDEFNELNAKLDAIMAHLGIEVVKQEYVVRKVK